MPFLLANSNNCSGVNLVWPPVTDPYTLSILQGYNLGGVPLMLVGFGKGVVGVVLRPGIGLLEASSKTAHCLALACLGKEGIVGTVQRRVRPPGASGLLLEESLSEVRSLANLLFAN